MHFSSGSNGARTIKLSVQQMVVTTSLTANVATMLIQDHHDETARFLIDDRVVDTKPYLPGASSYTSTGTPINGISFYQ